MKQEEIDEETVWATPTQPYKVGRMKQIGCYLYVYVQINGEWHNIPFSVGEIKQTLGYPIK